MTSSLLSRERGVILLVLIVLAIAAWAVVIWQAGRTGEEMSAGPSMTAGPTTMQPMTSSQPGSDASMASVPDEMSMGLTMDMGAGLFLAVWVAMMVAMMFPTSAPMILTFAKIQAARRAKSQLYVPTWIFVLGYIVLWSAAGIVAFVIASLADRAAQESEWVRDNAARIGGLILVIAGVYQLSPLKDKCLSQCRTPTTFIMTRWRDGARGALRMGLEHGIFCIGCCWLLFLILFPLGMANVAAMAGITLLIFAEKSLAVGRRVTQAAAVGLIAYGGAVLLFLPDALPTSFTTL
jgi:predicted metal-binding membrane protein